MVMAMFIFLAPGVGLFLGLTGVALFGVGGAGFFAGLAILGGDMNISILISTMGAAFAAAFLGTAAGIIGFILAIASLIDAIWNLFAYIGLPIYRVRGSYYEVV